MNTIIAQLNIKLFLCVCDKERKSNGVEDDEENGEQKNKIKYIICNNINYYFCLRFATNFIIKYSF